MQLSILITITLMAISTSVSAFAAKPIQVLSARRLSLVDERALNSDFTSFRVTRSHPQINGDNARRRRRVPSSGDRFYPRSSASLGQHIRSARVKLGLSQAELARRIGTATATLSRCEEGKLDLSASMLTATEKVLGVKLHG